MKSKTKSQLRCIQVMMTKRHHADRTNSTYAMRKANFTNFLDCEFLQLQYLDRKFFGIPAAAGGTGSTAIAGGGNTVLCRLSCLNMISSLHHTHTHRRSHAIGDALLMAIWLLEEALSCVDSAA